jgi:hypothetical protein
MADDDARAVIPFMPFPAGSVAVAAGGITAASFAPGAFASQFVKSVQYVSVTMAAVGTITSAIAAVGSVAIIIPAGFYLSGGATAEDGFTVWSFDSTTVARARRGGSGGTVVAAAFVVDFW